MTNKQNNTLILLKRALSNGEIQDIFNHRQLKYTYDYAEAGDMRTLKSLVKYGYLKQIPDNCFYDVFQFTDKFYEEIKI